MNASKMPKRLLTEVVAWCAERATSPDPSISLRPPALLSGIDRDALRLSGPLAQREPVVAAIARERARLLPLEGKYPSVAAGGLAGGRLLLYSPDDSLSDGAAEATSRGFFDAGNAPPWDTWLLYVRDPDRSQENEARCRDAAAAHDSWRPLGFASYLVSWVPPQLIEPVGAGIWANAEGCIAWASDVDTALTRELARAGLR